MKTRNQLASVKLGIYTSLFIVVLFSGCKTPQNLTSDKKLNQTATVSHDISADYEALFCQMIEYISKQTSSEYLNVSISQTEYDTEKPVIADTGKHPVKNETDISISSEKHTEQNDTLKVNTETGCSAEIEDNSQADIQQQSTGRQKTVVKTNDFKAGMAGIAFILLMIVVLVILIKFKRK